MSQNADTEAYAAMVQALKTFQEGLQEVQQSMEKAVEDCNDNMDQDPHAQKRTAEVAEILPKLGEVAEKAEQLAADIQAEIDRIESLN